MPYKIKVICLGDSITEGYGIDQNTEAPYPARLQQLLGDSYQVYNQGVSCTCAINRRRKGITLGQPYQLEEKYQDALMLKGDIYIIMLGTNDAQDGFNDETGVFDEYQNVYAFIEFFNEDYLKIINDIKNINQKAEIFIIKPIPVMESIWKKHQQSYLETILPRFDEISIDNPSLVLVDLQKVFLRYAYEDRKKLYQADGLHPNEEGAKVIAHSISCAVLNKTFS